MVDVVCFFFFQAEDGIRDADVTGVQTCALPIFLQEFYQVTFRKKIYQSMEGLQADLDEWLVHYNHERTHQGKMCCGRTPMDTFADRSEERRVGKECRSRWSQMS